MPENAPPPSPAQTTAATSVPASSPSETATLQPEPAKRVETQCLAKPVTLQGRLTPREVDPDLPSRLAACGQKANADECRYDIARAYFEANQFEEAAPIFGDVALVGTNVDIGVYAAQLYLECLNVLGTQASPPRPSCFDDIAREARHIKARYCTPKPARGNEEFCGILNRIESDILRRKAEGGSTG
jgi:hypothetical protein